MATAVALAAVTLPGRESQFAEIGPLDERLGDVLADENRPNGQPRVEGDTEKGLLGQAERKADDEDSDHGRGTEEFGDIGPGSDG